MLVDVPKQQVEEIGDLVRRHYPNADFMGTEPTVPPFP